MPLLCSVVAIATALTMTTAVSLLPVPFVLGQEGGDEAQVLPPYPAFGGVFDPASGLLFVPRFTEGTILAFQTRTGDVAWTASLTGQILGVQGGVVITSTPVLGSDRNFTVAALDATNGDLVVSCGPVALPRWWGTGPYNFAFDVQGSADESGVYAQWRASAEWRKDFPGEPEEIAPVSAVVRCDRASGALDTAWSGAVPTLPVVARVEATPFKKDFSKAYLTSEDGLHRLEGRQLEDDGSRYEWEVVDAATGEKVAGFDAPLPIRFIFYERTALIQLESTTSRSAKPKKDGCTGVVDEYTLKLQGRRPRSGKVKYDRVLARTTRCR